MNEDRELECVDCHNTFVFTAGEQDFYETKNLSAPKRCKKCRLKKKQARQVERQY